MADKKEVSLASLNVAQKVLAVDARYNSLRLMAYPRQSALVADSVYVASLWVVRTSCVAGSGPGYARPVHTLTAPTLDYCTCRNSVHPTTEPTAPRQRQPSRGNGCACGLPASPCPSFTKQVRTVAPPSRGQPRKLLAHQSKSQHGVAAPLSRDLLASVATATALVLPLAWPGAHQVS